MAPRVDRPLALGGPFGPRTPQEEPSQVFTGTGRNRGGGHLARRRAAAPVQRPGVASSPAGPPARRPRQRPPRRPGDPRRERASAPPAPTRQDPHPPGDGGVRRRSRSAIGTSPALGILQDAALRAANGTQTFRSRGDQVTGQHRPSGGSTGTPPAERRAPTSARPMTSPR